MNRILLLMLALLVLPAAQAALNPDRPFEEDADYVSSFDGVSTIVTGEVMLDTETARNGSVFLGAEAFSITGLTQVCWQPDNENRPRCVQEAGLRLDAGSGSSLAVRHPDAYGVSFAADFALSFFGDASSMFAESNTEDLGFGPSLMAIPVGGVTTLELGELPETDVSSFNQFNEFVNSAALVLTFTEASALTIRASDGSVVDNLLGAGKYVGFQGTPEVDPVAASIVALPTPDGTEVAFAPGSDEAAAEGLSPSHLQAAVQQLSASEGATDAQTINDLATATEGLSGLLNGAYLGLDVDNATGGAANLITAATVIRFDSMTATREGAALAMAGEGPLQMRSGTVVGADPLVGVFPWWSLLLWAVALGAFVLRVVMKPEKSHPTWDRFKWVGLAGGLVASLIVFWLWDLETKALWGTSFFSSGSSGVALGVIAALQLIPLALAALAIGLPVRILVKSGTRLAGQGDMMRIGAILAPFAVLLLGAPLMLDYLGLIVDVLQRFGQGG